MDFREYEDSRTQAAVRTKYQISVFRYVDLGLFVTPHSREWKDITTPAREGVVALTPWGLNEGEEVCRRVIDQDFEMDLPTTVFD